MTRTLLTLVIVSFAAGCAVEYEAPREAKTKKKSSASAGAAPAPVPSAAPGSVVAPPAPLAVRVEPARPSKPLPLIRLEAVRSDLPQPTAEKAMNDAINTARGELLKKLQSLDPPCYAKPSLAKIRNEYLKKDSIREIQPTASVKDEWKAKGLETNRVWVEVDLELSERQVQSLRSSERVSEGLGGAVLLLAFVAAAYGFLRLDAWTKGYLTIWLAIGAVVAIVSAIGLWSWQSNF